MPVILVEGVAVRTPFDQEPDRAGDAGNLRLIGRHLGLVGEAVQGAYRVGRSRTGL